MKQDNGWQFTKSLEIIKCREGNKEFMKERRARRPFGRTVLICEYPIEAEAAAEPRAPFALFTTPTQFSATDCPRCGCQIPLAVRVPRVTAPDTIERGDEEESEVAEDEDKEHWGDLQEE